MATLYENSTFDYVGQVRLIYGSSWYAQTFTPQITHNITSVILLLGRKPNASVGTVTVSIRATTAGKPSGEDLCSGTTEGNTLPELSEVGSPVEREITFGTNPTLSATTKYAIVVRALTADYDNGLYWTASTSSVYENGDQCASVNSGGTWTLYATRELWFKEYGNPVFPSAPINPTPAHEATGITLDDTTLSWEDGGGADTYDVYFRPYGEFFEKIASDITDTFVDAIVAHTVAYNGHYTYGELYLWCVIAKNEYGSNYAPPVDFGIGYGGTIWEFNAMVFDPPLPSGVTLSYAGDDDGVPTGTPTGENFMMAIRGLVAAANDKIWYEDI